MTSALRSLATQPTRTATDHVYDALYQAVISLDLPPGTKVSEAEISKRFDVSRQPVRDAFYRLAKMGLLAVRPQRATLVTKISQTAVRNAVFIRTALEVECLKTAYQLSGPKLTKQLRAGIAEQYKARDLKEPAKFHALDDEFHQTMCQHAGNAHAWTLIQEQKAHLDRVRYLTLSHERRTSVMAEHEEIVQALEDNDVERAEKRLRYHLGDINNVLMRLKEAHSEYLEDGT